MASTDYEFSGLILLSTNDSSGVEESLVEVLKPFTLKILDVQKIQLRGRLIIGMLIACDRAHAVAIEEDINAFSQSSGFDVAIDFSPLAE